MADLHESWRDVRDRAEALGLKLKLHFEQGGDDSDADPDGDPDGDNRAEQLRADARAAVEDLGNRLQDAFNAVEAAAKDTAVRSDVKEMGIVLKNALTETFSSVSADVGDAMRRSGGGDTTDTDAEDTVTDDTDAEDTVIDDDTVIEVESAEPEDPTRPTDG